MQDEKDVGRMKSALGSSIGAFSPPDEDPGWRQDGI